MIILEVVLRSFHLFEGVYKMSPPRHGTQIVTNERENVVTDDKPVKDLDELLQEDWENQGNPNYPERKEKRTIFDPSAPRW